MTAISAEGVATIVGTATNQGHAFDATHGGLIDGNDLDGTPNGGCSSQVRWPTYDCNIIQSWAKMGSINCLREPGGEIHTS